MIIVTGTIVARADALKEVLRLSLEHVHRSRLEPGCVSHNVHQSVEDPCQIVFLEEWADREALAAHFVVPESRDFVRSLGPLTSQRLPIRVYDATSIEL